VEKWEVGSTSNSGSSVPIRHAAFKKPEDGG